MQRKWRTDKSRKDLVMKFELLTAELYSGSHYDEEVTKICTQLKGTVCEKRISIVLQIDEYLKRTERKVFVDINSLEELKELYAIFDRKLILDFEEEPYIVIYDDYIE